MKLTSVNAKLTAKSSLTTTSIYFGSRLPPVSHWTLLNKEKKHKHLEKRVVIIKKIPFTTIYANSSLYVRHKYYL